MVTELKRYAITSTRRLPILSAVIVTIISVLSAILLVHTEASWFSSSWLLLFGIMVVPFVILSLVNPRLIFFVTLGIILLVEEFPVSQDLFQERWNVFQSLYDVRLFGLGLLDVLLVSLLAGVFFQTRSRQASLV